MRKKTSGWSVLSENLIYVLHFIDHILSKVRKRMKVNFISNIEAEKESFEAKDPFELGFGKWLTLEILSACSM